MDAGTTLGQLLHAQAMKNPADPALLLGEPAAGSGAQSMSFADLNAAARTLAGHLSMHLEARERALIVLEAGPLMPTLVLAAFLADVVAIPVCAPLPARDTTMFSHLLHECAPSLVLTTRRQRALTEGRGLPVVLCEELTGATPPQAPRRAEARQVAFIQHAFTGTLATCRALTHEEAIDECARAEAVGTDGWLERPDHFDVAADLIAPLYQGRPVAVPRPRRYPDPC